jgi:hypothetical protein
MSAQIKYAITVGSGQNGIDTEKRWRDAARKEGVEFPVWVKRTLEARALEILQEKTAA